MTDPREVMARDLLRENYSREHAERETRNLVAALHAAGFAIGDKNLIAAAPDLKKALETIREEAIRCMKIQGVADPEEHVKGPGGRYGYGYIVRVVTGALAKAEPSRDQ
jgi:hypothetical protein